MGVPFLVDIGAFVVAVSPWVTELERLPLHFKPPVLKELRGINNAVATILSGTLYIFVSQSHPDNLIRMWPWWIFFLMSAASFVFILILLLWKKEDVEDENNQHKWPVVVHSVLYCFLFCCITMGFGLVKLLEDHVHLTCKVIEAQTGSPVKNPLVSLYDADNKVQCQVDGGAGGYCETLIKKETCNNIKNWRLEVSAKGYNPAIMPIMDCTALLARWRKVRLSPQKN